jgi:hypothetical protein
MERDSKQPVYVACERQEWVQRVVSREGVILEERFGEYALWRCRCMCISS